MNLLRKGRGLQGQINQICTSEVNSSQRNNQQEKKTVTHQLFFGQICCFSNSITRTKSPTHYYDVLNITVKANHRQIKDAYYTLSKKFHPDVNSSSEAHVKFQEISQAYEVLGTPATRRMYDRGIFRPEHANRKQEPSEHSDIQFSQDRIFKKRRQKPPTGKTEHYDYDEYYKKHYNDNRLRRQKDLEYETYLKEMKAMEESSKGSNAILFFASILVCFTFVVYGVN